MDLPEIAIRTALMRIERCGICGAEAWDPVDPSALIAPDHWDAYDFPCAYTIESLTDKSVPQIICDSCVREHYPDTFTQLVAERDYFWSN